MKRLASAGLVGLLVAASAELGAAVPVAAATPITIGATPGAILNAQFDTQDVYPGIIASQPIGTGGITSFDRLSALGGTAFRIHAGTDGTYAGTTCSNGATPALPFNAAYTSANNVCVTAWDFRNLNSMLVSSHDSGAGGTVSYGSTTLTDTSKNWQPSIWAGRRVTVGAQSLVISGNTATALTLTTSWSPTPSAGTGYTIPSTSAPVMLDVRYLPDNMYGGTGPMGGNASAQGGILDMTYQAYASYMAALVGYYNKGISPVGANPATPPPGLGPIQYWEIYNEPDYASENPRIPPTLPTPSGITLTGATVTGGTLSAGTTYSYQVAAVTTGDGAGHTAASTAQTVTLTAGQNAVQVNIPRTASNALGKIAPGYFIYGRTGTLARIGFAGRDSNAGADLVWTDKGTGTPSGAAPTANTTGGEDPFDPLEYKRMWDVVVPAMKAVDPTIKVIGPVPTNPISISPPSVVITAQTFSPGDNSWFDSRDYVQVLMTSVNKPDIVSYHGYGGFTGSESEQVMLDAVDNPSDSNAMVQAISSNILPYTGSTPLWHTETAPNAAFGDPRNLEAEAFGAAWYGHLFSHLGPLSPSLDDLFQFEFVNSPVFGLVAEPGTPVPGATAGNPYLPYWSIYEINRYFPRGSKLLPVSNVPSGVDVIAALIPPSFTTVDALVVNRQPGATCCAGVTLTPSVALAGLTSNATTQTIVDSTINLANGPATSNLGATSSVPLTMNGYSVALLQFVTGAVTFPTVTMVSPNSGAAAGGTSVTITGTNFTGATSVKFGATPAATFTVNSATSISATSPAGLGSVDITVTTPSGTSVTSAADQFSYTPVSICYFNWYDRASAGMMADNIHLLNTSGATSHFLVTLPGVTGLNATVTAGSETYLNFPQGTIGGPVTVSSDQTFLATQRVQYYQSFNEVKCESPSQADTTLYLPWFDKASTGMVGDNVHILNPGGTATTGTVSLPGQSPLPFALGPGAETYVTFPFGTIGGPVKIAATGAVLAAQRVQYYQTFNEEIAQSPSTGQTTGFFNWFDKASAGMVNDNVHVVNPGAAPAHVTINLPGQTAVGATIAAAGTAYLSFPAGVIGGPVTLTSDVPVLASQRVQYYQSFNEVPLASAAQASTSLHVMWFDKASAGMLADNIHLLNPGAVTATITISVPGATTLHVTAAVGVETYASFPAGTIGGPVTITSDQPILAAQRIQYYQTFNEVAAA